MRLALASALLLTLCLPGAPARAEREPDRRARQLARTVAESDATEPATDAPSADPSGDDGALEHEVAAGETASAIADRYGVTLDALLAANPGLEADRIRERQRLRVPSDLRRARHEVRAGETLTAIAVAYGVTRAELLRDNPGLEPDRLRAGQALRVLSRKPETPSASIGSPNRGRLQDGRPLPPGPGYRVRERARAFGTDETVRGLVESFGELVRRYPHAPALAVHDLSLRRGGRMDDHVSHQSGRDADVAYPRRRCLGVCEFEHVSPHELDAARTFAFLRPLLERGELEAVFIDYRLQAPLYAAARAQGASSSELSRWFQYPRGRGDALGVIRHVPKHADHMHLRFRCHDSDAECKSLRPLLVQTATRESD